MKSEELLEILRKRMWLFLAIVPTLLGAVVGVFVLLPVSEFVFYHDHYDVLVLSRIVDRLLEDEMPEPVRERALRELYDLAVQSRKLDSLPEDEVSEPEREEALRELHNLVAMSRQRGDLPEDRLPETGREYALRGLRKALGGDEPVKTLLYALVGAGLGFLAGIVFYVLQRRTARIQRLISALGTDLTSIIAQGESDSLEFKSTFRWDLKQEKANRALEGVVLKTLAGFMNGEGGTLLVGVADDGQVLGLEKDYGLLKRGDRDGFDQALMTAVSTKLGTDACHQLHVLFHTTDGKDVCRVIVAPSPRPVYVKDNQDTKFYLRTGGGTRELSVQEAVRFIHDHWRR